MKKRRMTLKGTIKLIKEDYPLRFWQGIYVTLHWMLKADCVNITPKKVSDQASFKEDFALKSPKEPIVLGDILMEDVFRNALIADISELEKLQLTNYMFNYVMFDKILYRRFVIEGTPREVWFNERFTSVLLNYDIYYDVGDMHAYIVNGTKIIGTIMPSIVNID